MFNHRIYGHLVSSDIPLFEWNEHLEFQGCEPEIKLQRSPTALKSHHNYEAQKPLSMTHGRSVILRSDALKPEHFTDQRWCFEVEGVVCFFGSGSTGQITYESENGVEDALIAFWFVHILLPFFLAVEQGHHFIHAAAVEVSGSSAVFVAPSHGGKSTLANYFIEKGHQLISDDKLAIFSIEGKPCCIPSHPYHRPYRKYEDLGVSAKKFDLDKKPLGTIFSLQKNLKDTAITLNPIQGLAAFQLLKQHSLYDFPFLDKTRLNTFGIVANHVPIRSLKRPWGLDYLEDIYQRICEFQEQQLS